MLQKVGMYVCKGFKGYLFVSARYNISCNSSANEIQLKYS